MGDPSKYKDLSKNTLLFAISSFGPRIITFLFVPLYTYVLSTEDYGNIDVVSTTAQLLIPVLTLNIQDAILRYALDKDYKSEEVLGAGIRIIGISSLLFAAVLVMIYNLKLFDFDVQHYYYLFFAYFLGVLNNCFSMYLRAKDRVHVLVFCGLSNALLTCLLNILLLLVVQMGVTGYLIANVAGTAVSVLVAFFFGKIWKEIKIRNAGKLLKEMVPYSLPLVLNSLAWWINNASDRYILTYYRGAAENGIYAISYKVPTILAAIQSVFYNAWSITAITKYDKEDMDGFIGNVYSLYSAVSFIVCSVLLLGNIIIAHLLYKGGFFEAWQYVPPLLMGTTMNGIALFEGCLFVAVKKTRAVSITTIAGAIVNTALNFILIPYIGALGAAVSTMLGYSVIWIIRTWQLRKIVKMKTDWINQFVTIGLLLLQTVIALYQKIYWAQIPISILILFLQRRQFFQLVSLIRSKIRGTDNNKDNENC